jgi:hypothetical protein
MLKFDDIPDISDVANFLSKNNLDTASTEDVWAVARQFEDVPNFDNIFLELTYEQIPQAIENYFLNPSNKEDIAEEIKSVIEMQSEYNYAIDPDLIQNLSDDNLSKLLLAAVEKYQDKKESITDVFNNYGIMETSINNLASDVYINGETVGSEDDFVKHTISAMLFEYSDEFSLTKTVEQVLSNPSEHLTLQDDVSKQNKVKP